MKLSDILYENEATKRYIIQGKYGRGHYEVWESGITHSERKATIHWSLNDSLAFVKAKEIANRSV